MLLQNLDQAADNRIGVRNLAIVWERGVVGLERLRRIIGVVGIVEMQPDEEWPLLMMAQPPESAVGNILSPPLHALVAVFSWLAHVEVGVIDVKPTLKAGGRRCRIENVGPNKRCRVIAVVVQQIRQIG